MQDRLTELKEQLKRAVRPDSQLRVFYCGTYPAAPLPNLLEGAVDMGLVFTCTRGTVDLHEGGICGTPPPAAPQPQCCAAWSLVLPYAARLREGPLPVYSTVRACCLGDTSLLAPHHPTCTAPSRMRRKAWHARRGGCGGT